MNRIIKSINIEKLSKVVDIDLFNKSSYIIVPMSKIQDIVEDDYIIHNHIYVYEVGDLAILYRISKIHENVTDIGYIGRKYMTSLKGLSIKFLNKEAGNISIKNYKYKTDFKNTVYDDDNVKINLQISIILHAVNLFPEILKDDVIISAEVDGDDTTLNINILAPCDKLKQFIDNPFITKGIINEDYTMVTTLDRKNMYFNESLSSIKEKYIKESIKDAKYISSKNLVFLKKYSISKSDDDDKVFNNFCKNGGEMTITGSYKSPLNNKYIVKVDEEYNTLCHRDLNLIYKLVLMYKHNPSLNIKLYGTASEFSIVIPAESIKIEEE